MSEREARIAANEANFRAVNEEIAEEDVLETLLSILCECGRATCSEPVQISRRHYEAVRSDPTLFIIVPGHELEEAESVEQREFHYAIVRKHEGVPAQIARQTDPKRR